MQWNLYKPAYSLYGGHAHLWVVPLRVFLLSVPPNFVFECVKCKVTSDKKKHSNTCLAQLS